MALLQDALRTPRGRRWLFALLYFVEGAPIGYIWIAIPTRLRAAGVSVEEIGTLSALVTIPWTLKFLWAPLVDTLRLRRTGLRGWIMGTQFLMGATLIPTLGLDLASESGRLVFLLLVHAVAAATQDVAIDALAVQQTPANELGSITGWMQVGQLAGRAAFGGLALAMESWVGARAIGIALIALVWASAVLIWVVPEATSTSPVRLRRRWRAFGDLVGAVFTRQVTWLGLLVASIAGAGMEATTVVAGPMLLDLGVEQASIGFFFAGPAIVCMGLGALLGGRRADRSTDLPRGRERSVRQGIVLVAVTVVGTALIVTAAPSSPLVFVSLALAHLSFGHLTACLYSLLMSLTTPEVGGTQFSTFMGGINLCSVWAAWLVGRAAGTWGYPIALGLLATLSLASLPILAAIRRDLAVPGPAMRSLRRLRR